MRYHSSTSAMTKTLLLIAVAVTHAYGATILWNQQPNTNTGGIQNQEFSDYPGFSTYQVNDIIVTGSSWHITAIREYYTNNIPWPANFNVRLNIFSKTGVLPLPSDAPSNGLVYAATDVAGAITIDGLDINLAPGAYWIGFTPQLDLSRGAEYQLFALSKVGDSSALRNPGGNVAVGTDWVTPAAFGSEGDGSITVFGDTSAPEPAVFQLMLPSVGILGLLYRRKTRA